MKHEFESNYGNFDYLMTVETEDEILSPLAARLVKEGIANIAYRVAGSSVDKALKVGLEGRRSVEYSEENAAKVNASVAATIAKLEEKEEDALPEGITFKVTGQHTFGEGAESAMALATRFVQTLMEAGKESDLRAVLSLYGAKDDASVEELIETAHKAGLGKRKAKKA